MKKLGINIYIALLLLLTSTELSLSAFIQERVLPSRFKKQLLLAALEQHQRYITNAHKVLPEVHYKDKVFLTKIIHDDYPELAINSLRFYASGSNNILFKVNTNLFFRFLRDCSPNLKAKMKRFWRVAHFLRQFNNKITVKVPEIKYFGKKYLYVGYEKIEGEYLTYEVYRTLTREQKDQLVNDIALFLHELHSSLSEARAEALGLPNKPFTSFIDEIITALKRKESDKNVILLAQIVKLLLNEIYIKNSEKAVIHGDLHRGNIAFDTTKKRINGVYDFDSLHIGDIHEDFIYFYKIKAYDDDFLGKITHAYEKLSGKKINTYRVGLYCLFRQLYEVSKFNENTSEDKKRKTYITLWCLSHDLGIMPHLSITWSE